MLLVSDVSVAHGIAQASGFEHKMEAIGAKRIKRSDIEVLKDVQHHQRGEPLRIWRDLDELQPAVVGRDGSHHLAAVSREIFKREERTARAERLRHVVADLTFIEGRRTMRHYSRQRIGERGKADHVTFTRRAAAEQIMSGGPGIRLELADVPLPIPGYTGGDGKSVLGISDRGRKRAIE